MKLTHKIVYGALRWPVALFLLIKFNYRFSIAKNLPENYIVLSNHTTDFDPLFVALSFPKQMYFVASEHIARWKNAFKFIRFGFDPIMRYKGSVAASTVMEVLRRVRDGNRVCIFAEGVRSWDGRTSPILPATGKMVKSARCGLITFEAEVNFPEGSYGSSSPIIANWPNSDTRDSFGFQIRDNGSPAIYYYQTYYDAATSTTMTDNNIMVKFNYSVIGKGWVRIAVSCETESGSSVYKLYVDGELVETIYDYPYVHTIDPVFSQNSTRELSIGNDGKNYFKGQLRTVAVYRDPLSADEAKNPAAENMQNGDSNLMAYYNASNER